MKKRAFLMNEWIVRVKLNWARRSWEASCFRRIRTLQSV